MIISMTKLPSCYSRQLSAAGEARSVYLKNLHQQHQQSASRFLRLLCANAATLFCSCWWILRIFSRMIGGFSIEDRPLRYVQAWVDGLVRHDVCFSCLRNFHPLICNLYNGISKKNIGIKNLIRYFQKCIWKINPLLKLIFYLYT